MRATPRPGVHDLEPYVSPQLRADVRLSANECPHPLPETFARDLADAVGHLPLHRYPDGQMTELREALAVHHGHPVEGIWPANGSNEVLAQLLLAYGGPGRRAAVLEPTFLLHARLSTITSTGVVHVRMDPPFTITDRHIDEVLRSAPDVVFVCSPNNPTGNAQPLEMIAEMAGRTDALVIVDEAYVEFGGESALKLTTDHANLAVVRTFSKAFAMAGVRLGYVLADPSVVHDLQRVRLPYHLSSLTQTAGVVALRHAGEALGILDAVRRQRDRLMEALRAMPDVTVFPSDANFVLFVPPRPAGEVWQGLLERGVLIRDLSSVLPNALRVTAGTEHEVARFLDVLREVLDG